jgi:hypothetical protein
MPAGSKPGERRGGRQKGTPNKIPAELKEIILAALHGAHKDGAVAYLQWLAVEHPPAFLGLVGKVLPMTVVANQTIDNRITIEGGLPSMPQGEDAVIAAVEQGQLLN